MRYQLILTDFGRGGEYVAERFYWKGMVADTFYFYDTFMPL